VTTLRQRVDELRGKESLTDFAARVGIERATLYAAFKREELTGLHTIDQLTAKLIADKCQRSVAWVLGELPVLAIVQPAERDAARAAGEDQSMPPHLSKVMPALAHELDPTTQDAMRWRALAEMQNDGADVAEAFRVLGTIEFHREVRAVSWGDFYAAAKRALKSEGRDATGADL